MNNLYGIIPFINHSKFESMKVPQKTKIRESTVSKTVPKAKDKNFYKNRLKATVACKNCSMPVHLNIYVKNQSIDLTESDSDDEMPSVEDARSSTRGAFKENSCVELPSEESSIESTKEEPTEIHRNLTGVESDDHEDSVLEDLDNKAPQLEMSLGGQNDKERFDNSTSAELTALSKSSNGKCSTNITLTGMDSVASKNPKATKLTTASQSNIIFLGGESEDEAIEQSSENPSDEKSDTRSKHMDFTKDSDEEMPEVTNQRSEKFQDVEILSEGEIDEEGLDSLLESPSDESCSEEF